MAGEWIKMRSDLLTSPKVVRIASALRADRLRVIGGLHAVWCLFDVHSEDGKLSGYTPEIADEMIGWPGFSAAMIAVGWLEIGPDFLAVPRFDDHNGQSAKRRAMEAARKRNERAEASASDADKKRTREEKRRSNTPKAPKGAAKASSTTTFKTWIDGVKDSGEKAIPDDHPVFAYAEKVGIPQNFLRLHWLAFRERYLSVDKRYRDWRKVFHNSVRGNWFHLWLISGDGDCRLTTTGIQAQRNFAEAA